MIPKMKYPDPISITKHFSYASLQVGLSVQRFLCVPSTLFKKHFNHVESFGLIQLFAWYIITAWYGTRLAMTVNVVCLQSLYNMALKVCVWSQRERVEWRNSAAYLSVILSQVNLFQVRLHRLGF